MEHMSAIRILDSVSLVKCYRMELHVMMTIQTRTTIRARMVFASERSSEERKKNWHNEQKKIIKNKK